MGFGVLEDVVHVHTGTNARCPGRCAQRAGHRKDVGLAVRGHDHAWGVGGAVTVGGTVVDRRDDGVAAHGCLRDLVHHGHDHRTAYADVATGHAASGGNHQDVFGRGGVHRQAYIAVGGHATIFADGGNDVVVVHEDRAGDADTGVVAVRQATGQHEHFGVARRTHGHVTARVQSRAVA